MPWNESLYGWLVYSAILSLAVLTIGSAAALLCRQPARRLQIIELSLAGCLIAPCLGMIPGYPQLAVGWLHAAPAGTGPFFGEKTPFADKRLAENMDLSPSAARGAPGTGPFFGGKTPFADKRLTENMDLSPSSRHGWGIGSWLVGLYLLGVALGVAWWLAGVAALVRLIGTAHAVPPRCRELLAEIAGRPGDRVRLLASCRAKQPFAFAGVAVRLVGVAVKLPPQRVTLPPQRTLLPPQHAAWRRAVIVLPQSLCDDEQAVRWALAHEWTHIERHDFRAWLAAGLARVLFFYQPLVWWLHRQLRLCQDLVADAQASQQTPRREDYAEFLFLRAVAGSLHPAMVGLGMGFSKRRSELYRRIVMLVQNPPLESRAPRLWTVSVSLAAVVLVAIVAALTLAPQAAAQGEPADKSEAKPAAVNPKPSATEPFTAKLPCGVEVELVGVSEHPSKDRPWWRPDGSSLSQRPYDSLGHSVAGGKDEIVREVTVRLSNLPSEPVGTSWRLGLRCDGGNPTRLGAPVTDIRAVSVHVPVGKRALTVRFGAAAGPWKTKVERDQHDRTLVSPIDRGIVFAAPIEMADKTVVQVAYATGGGESRIVAVDEKGQEHAASSVKDGFAGDVALLTAVFSNVPLKQIKQFRLQTRPYQWVEFRNVSLRPGQKTQVEAVVVTPDEAAKVQAIVHPFREYMESNVPVDDSPVVMATVPGRFMLSQRSVQAELNLTNEQKQQLSDIVAKFLVKQRRFMPSIPYPQSLRAKRAEEPSPNAPTLAELQQQTSKLNRDTCKQMDKVLTPQQLTALKDIMLRERLFSVIFEPAVLGKLGMSTEQKKELIQHVARLMNEAQRKYQSTSQKINEQAMAVLTPQQRAQIQEEVLRPGSSVLRMFRGADLAGVPMPRFDPFPDPDLRLEGGKELNLSATQQDQVRAIMKKYEEQSHELDRQWRALSQESNANLRELRKDRLAISQKSEQMATDRRKEIEGILTPRQLESYKRLALRNVASNVLHDEQTLRKIGATKEQNAALRRLEKEMLEKPEQTSREMADKAIKLLTPSQQAILREEVDKIPCD